MLERQGVVEMTTLDVGLEWFHLIAAVNRAQLVSPPVRQLHRQSGVSGLAWLDARFSHWLAGTRSRYESLWTVALNALGAEWAHRLTGDPEDLAALREMFERNLDSQGRWLTPTDRVDYAMKGYSLIYLAQVTDEPRLQNAADHLTRALLEDHPRARDGSLPYEHQSQAILVDALAMICPYLARYWAWRGEAEALSVCTNQLLQFVRNNVDGETHLPYHGYYAGGPRRLGMHGWGRGTGWYLLALIDTLAEMPEEHPDCPELHEAFVAAARSLLYLQRDDGHWSWGVLHRIDRPDSSATSLIGYGLARGVVAGILDDRFRPAIEAAVGALLTVTRSDGLLDGSSGECRGLGKYPQIYGPQPWLQGAAIAFSALYLMCQGEDSL
jgi:unsaturated rhamnogalacturonyl hydrolase